MKLADRVKETIKNNRPMVVGGIIGLAFGAGVAGAMTGFENPQAMPNLDGASIIRAKQVTPIKPPAGAPMSFADMIERVSPAVVSIETRGKVKVNPGIIPGFGGTDESETQGDEKEFRSAGSGFFITSDGYIVTNNHVIEDADEITVTLTTDKKLKATVVGRDPATDLAVLKVEGKDFPFVTFELDHRPRVGDWVVAVGNPFGFAGTATAGIVSAHGRNINESGTNYVDYLQIDAAINRGNSGGPTFDLYGRVIGVNTIIVSPSGGSAGVGFAIPAEVAYKISNQLMKGSKIERGYIGVSIVPVTEEVAKALNLTDLNGAYVADITAGGPADKAGIEPGDIIKSVNGKPIKSPTELTRSVADVKVGEKIVLGVWRAGQMITLNMTAALRPSEDQLAQGAGPDDNSTDAPEGATAAPKTLGLAVKPLSPEVRKEYGIADSVKSGVVIISVDPQSEAGKVGVRAGDVIVRADNKAVASQAELQTIVDDLIKANRPSILLLINREGRNVPLPLSLKPKDQ